MREGPIDGESGARRAHRTRRRLGVLRSAASAAAAIALALLGCRGGPSLETVDLLAPPVTAELLRDVQTIDLGADEPDTQAALLAGWSRRESGWNTTFAWVEGPRASLRFFSARGGATSVRFRALPALGVDSQEVNVRVNRRDIGGMPMPNGWSDYGLVAPSAVVHRGLNTLEFEFRVVQPATRSDPRQLAAAFDVIRIAPSPGGDPVDAGRPAVDAAGHLRLPPGSGVRFVIGADAPASLAVSVECASPAGADVRLAFWLCDPAATGTPPTLLEDSACATPATGSTVVREIPLPPGAAGVRDLYVVHAGASAAPAAQIERLALTRPTQPSTDERPNVLLVVLDALRADHLHLYGYGRETSPWLDRFAAQGALFTNAFAQGSQTITSVPSILTGTYPPQHGVGEHSALTVELPTLPALLAAHGYATVAVSANELFGPAFGLARGFADFYQMAAHTLPHALGIDGVVRAESVLDAATRWLARARTQPFFMVLHFLQPHTPYAPPPPYWGSFAGATDGFDGSEDMLTAAQQLGPEATHALRGAAVDRYDENIRYVDAAFGRLLRQLELLGLLERTVAIVAADHGEQFLEHGRFSHPFNSLHEESLHVPLIIRLPRTPRPQRIETLVETIDIGATVLDLARMAPSLGDGRSLVPLLTGSAFPERPVLAFARSDNDAPAFDLAAVRTRAFKLIRNSALAPELYDLGRDPTEQHDVAADLPADAAELAALLDGARAARLTAEARPAPMPKLDAQARERLRALGYLREED